MKERPILFNSEMVRAILAGRKTQTRRVIKRSDNWHVDIGRGRIWPVRENEYGDWYDVDCSYGQPGDRLWVREAFAYHPDGEGKDVIYRATDPGWDENNTGLRWRPSIHMPRWASRIQLEVTSVRVEPVQDISADDCVDEGLDPSEVPGIGSDWSFIKAFSELWDTINAGRGYSWESNPRVWVVEFSKINKTREKLY